MADAPLTLALVLALLPVGGVVWGAARIASRVDALVLELQAFKQEWRAQSDRHDTTIRALERLSERHDARITQLETDR